MCRDCDCRLGLVVVLLEKLFILLDRFLLKVLLFLLLKFLVEDLRCRYPCDFQEFPRLQPAIGKLELIPD